MPGETFTTPEALMTYSGEGFGAIVFEEICGVTVELTNTAVDAHGNAAAHYSEFNDNVGEDTMQLFRDCMVFPTIVGMSDNFWCGRSKDRPELRRRLPFQIPQTAADPVHARLSYHIAYGQYFEIHMTTPI